MSKITLDEIILFNTVDCEVKEMDDLIASIWEMKMKKKPEYVTNGNKENAFFLYPTHFTYIIVSWCRTLVMMMKTYNKNNPIELTSSNVHEFSVLFEDPFQY